MSKFTRFRDSITGLFTTKANAQANPDTTQGIADNRFNKAKGGLLSPRKRSEAIHGAYAASDSLRRRMAGDDTMRVGDVFTEEHGIGSGLKVVVLVQVMEDVR